MTTTNIANTINWLHISVMAISTFIAVISGLLLYILKDWYSGHKHKKTTRKTFCNEISFNIAQLKILKSAIINLKDSIDNNRGKLSFNKFNNNEYNTIFTYSLSVFTKLVTSGGIFELMDSKKLIELDTTYKTFQTYSTTGQILNEHVLSSIENAQGMFSKQENSLLEYNLLDEFVSKLGSQISFLKNCKLTINKVSKRPQKFLAHLLHFLKQ